MRLRSWQLSWHGAPPKVKRCDEAAMGTRSRRGAVCPDALAVDRHSDGALRAAPAQARLDRWTSR